MLSIVRLSPRYQLTLPQDVRQALGCQARDRIAFRSDDSGRITLENMKSVDVDSVRGLLRSLDEAWWDPSEETTDDPEMHDTLQKEGDVAHDGQNREC